MSNKQLKNKKNTPGQWYCTDPSEENGEGCIACGECYGGAPQFFASDDIGHAYVKKQPANDEEIELCKVQQEICPVKSIGNDG